MISKPARTNINRKEEIMAIKFDCPHCKQTLKAKDAMAGQKAKCPKCNKEITVPAKKE
jgi:uncharacterized paraquat-inducible protein A